MRKRDQPVKITKAVAVLYKYCHMVDWRRVVVWIVNEDKLQPRKSPWMPCLRATVTGIWECLNDSVIRHSTMGRMPPGMPQEQLHLRYSTQNPSNSSWYVDEVQRASREPSRYLAGASWGTISDAINTISRASVIVPRTLSSDFDPLAHYGGLNLGSSPRKKHLHDD